MRGALVALLAASALAAPLAARGDDAGPTADAGVPTDAGPTADAGTIADGGDSVHGCVPSLARGASRPVVTEDFPHRGTSGFVATLTLTMRHGKGERVLPSGFRLQQGTDAEKELKAAGFAFPEQDGGTGAARLVELAEDPAHPEIATTVLEVPFVVLPEKPGRNVLVLPPLPVAVARANGDLSTVCTRAHTITVEDPIADTPDPSPRQNPPPRPQREEWKEAKIATAILATAIVLGAVFAFLHRRWKNRPKPVPPPPPPRPAWEVALEKLSAVRHAGLLDTERAAEYCDRVSDALREYVGKTLGFDGLERTTDEIAFEIDRSAMADSERAKVLAVLRECDLVKFAKFVPETGACVALLDDAEAHVRRTMPRKGAPPRARPGATTKSDAAADSKAVPGTSGASNEPVADNEAAGAEAAPATTDEEERR